MFEQKGYFKEYYVNGKFIGTVSSDKDREVIGYNGRKEEILLESVTTQNNKVIKKGLNVVTMLYPLNGKKL